MSVLPDQLTVKRRRDEFLKAGPPGGSPSAAPVGCRDPPTAPRRVTKTVGGSDTAARQAPAGSYMCVQLDPSINAAKAVPSVTLDFKSNSKHRLGGSQWIGV